ncbi:MAG: epoxyqueuosine reductase QueH [Candidatus Margulisbacteria bacterium]|jgi:predicted adenine nucleotide alpha hydrolase (AANH) superfamily ATPase|nr:epoxyqueuosine reductase QueH [Candidatus Margulisiibacteriota bacterium]
MKRPRNTKLLLHACCAPCASAVLEKLSPRHNLTFLYFNPNIQPAAEYQKRLAEFSKLKTKFKFVAAKYEPAGWLAFTQDLSAEPEGGARCQQCFNYRLDYAARTAAELDFPEFGTTLSISPHKNLEQVNTAGRAAAQKYAVKFIEFDFSSLFRRSIELSKKLGLYRQKYCGCLFARDVCPN